jgi:hypothetical protein
MDYDVEFNGEMFYKAYYCLDCDTEKEVYSARFHKECIDAGIEDYKLLADYYSNLI